MPLLDCQSPQAPQPNKLTTPLKPHQLALIKACQDFEIENQHKTGYESSFDVGLIGDRVGSGKSLVTLGIIGNNQPIQKPNHFKYKIREYSGYRQVCTVNKNVINCHVDINMVIVPHPTFGQWKSYIKNDTNMNVLYINGLKELKLMDEDIPKIESIYDTDNLNAMIKDFFKPYDLVCISSLRIKELTNSAMNIYNYFNYVSFNRIFIDECDSIQLKNGFQFRATFYWMISSSSHNIKLYHPSYGYANSNPNITDINEYYDSRNGYVRLKKIGGITTQNNFIKKKLEFCALVNSTSVFEKFHFRNTNEFIDTSFKMNEPNILKIICKNPLFMKIVGDVLSNSIINRINAGDMSGALGLFKCEKTNDENIIQTVCRDLTERLGANNLKITKAAEKTAITTLEVDQKHKLLQKLNTKSTDLKEKIKNIQDKIKSNNLCCICYDEPETKMMTMCCNSLYCMECITHWMKNNITCPTCPFCRNNITNKSLLAVDNSYKEEVSVIPTSNHLKDKMDNFKDLMYKLTNDPVKTHKILVFSDFVAIFEELQEYFKDNGIKFTKISGSSKVIENKIINYKSNVIDVLLLNSKTCGSGLNLENTTDIIIYHQVNKDLQTQIIGRALRPGHEGELNVHKLLNESENE